MNAIAPSPGPTEASKAPVRKVVAATGGAGVGAVLANLVVWGLDELMDPAIANSVPEPVSTAVYVLVPMAVAFLGGYFVKRAPGE